MAYLGNMLTPCSMDWAQGKISPKQIHVRWDKSHSKNSLHYKFPWIQMMSWPAWTLLWENISHIELGLLSTVGGGSWRQSTKESGFSKTRIFSGSESSALCEFDWKTLFSSLSDILSIKQSRSNVTPDNIGPHK